MHGSHSLGVIVRQNIKIFGVAPSPLAQIGAKWEIQFSGNPNIIWC